MIRPAALVFLLPVAVAYYGFLLTAGGSYGLLFPPLDYGLTFNSMLLHLLHGRFDVDPAAIGIEGFLRDGAVYSYFGIFPALLRAPLLALPDFATIDFTRVSCLLAVSLMALFKALSAIFVSRSARTSDRSLLLPLLLRLLLKFRVFAAAWVGTRGGVHPRANVWGIQSNPPCIRSILLFPSDLGAAR